MPPPAMRKFLRLLPLLAFAAARAAPADGLELNGVLVSGGRTQVALLNPATGEARWVRVGGKFSGHTVLGYDAATNTATLARDGQPALALRLRDAVLLVAPPAPPWAQPSNEQRAAIVENLRRLAAAAARHHADTGLGTVTFAELLAADPELATPTPAAGESYADLVLRSDTPALAITTPDGTRITSDGTSTAADGSAITPDGGRVAPDGTAYAADGSPLGGNTAGTATGPFIPLAASPTTARALLAAGWRYRPAGWP